MLIVLDTNVLVSSLLKRESNPAIILNAVLEGKMRLAIDERIFEEYTRVLHRPRINIIPVQADSILKFIAYSALWVQSQPWSSNKVLSTTQGTYLLPKSQLAAMLRL
jgi:putative PIN family toxin of toxin-antitoxin system